uniref:Uncharacterized protein n=1 Tax=Brassica oleracea TaxID=3712 RepID=A0A3P6DIX0_BRAOL|nr:unnamed protein product [Brassica oleracea]
MFDYFYNNRGLQFLIAESMSQNAPLFNDTLLKKLHHSNLDVGAYSSSGDDAIRSITRFLLYHPVNEFEPFFESLGLKPSEFSRLVTCWRITTGVLASKIQAFEGLGFSKLFVSKLIVCSPRILIGEMNVEVVKVIEMSPELGKCVWNLRHCFLFLRGIKMEAYEIGKVFRCHSHWLGVSRLKHTSTFLNTLKGGKKRLCQVIQENPEEMKKWTYGVKSQAITRYWCSRRSWFKGNEDSVFAGARIQGELRGDGESTQVFPWKRV